MFFNVAKLTKGYLYQTLNRLTDDHLLERSQGRFSIQSANKLAYLVILDNLDVACY
jgi:hypothetical protein